MISTEIFQPDSTKGKGVSFEKQSREKKKIPEDWYIIFWRIKVLD